MFLYALNQKHCIIWELLRDANSWAHLWIFAQNSWVESYSPVYYQPSRWLWWVMWEPLPFLKTSSSPFTLKLCSNSLSPWTLKGLYQAVIAYSFLTFDFFLKKTHLKSCFHRPLHYWYCMNDMVECTLELEIENPALNSGSLLFIYVIWANSLNSLSLSVSPWKVGIIIPSLLDYSWD